MVPGIVDESTLTLLCYSLDDFDAHQMTTYKEPQSIRIASRKLSLDALRDLRFVVTVLIAVSAVKLVKPRCRTMVPPNSLDLNHPGSLFSSFSAFIQKNVEYAKIRFKLHAPGNLLCPARQIWSL